MMPGMVAAGVTDVAAIDVVTLGVLAKHAPAAVAGLRVLDYSVRGRSLPYATSRERSDSEVDLLRAELAAAIADPDLVGVREALCLAGFDVAEEDEYARIDAITASGRDVVLAPEDRPVSA